MVIGILTWVALLHQDFLLPLKRNFRIFCRFSHGALSYDLLRVCKLSPVTPKVELYILL